MFINPVWQENVSSLRNKPIIFQWIVLFFFSLRSFIRVYLSQTDTYAGKQDLKCSGEMKFHFGLVEAKFKEIHGST